VSTRASLWFSLSAVLALAVAAIDASVALALRAPASRARVLLFRARPSSTPRATSMACVASEGHGTGCQNGSLNGSTSGVER